MVEIESQSLFDGKYSIRDMVDLERLQGIFEKFTLSTGYAIGFLDHPGMNVLIAAGWRGICTQFHRAYPGSQEICQISNRRLIEKANEPGRIVIEECENGLLDCATPIIIMGKRIATLFLGQLLLNPPDIRRFTAQAAKFGYDEVQYLKALKEIPVVSQDKLRTITEFLSEIAMVISEMGYARLELKERAVSLEKEVADRKKAERILRQREEEVKKLNEELEQRVKDRTAQLEEANKELEAFSYSVSHDLRTPLRSIDGFGQLIEEEYGNLLDDRGKDYLSRMRRNCRRMAELIDDLLNLSRITRAEIKRKDVDLTVLGREILVTLQAGDAQRRVEWVVAEELKVNADENLIRIVLENLLSNAWKFTRYRDPAKIELGVTQQEGKSVYFVRDNGAGFDMTYAKKLFGAFQRLHTEKEFEGTGIGLATVQRIIARHGGRVWAEAQTEHGATFFFFL